MVSGCLHWPDNRQGQRQLETARQHLADFNFKAALEENQSVLARLPSRLGDQAFFQIGQVYAHPRNPDLHYQKSLASFQRIPDRYPASRLRAEAELWMAIIRQLIDQQNQIQRLTQKHTPLEKTLKSQRIKIKQLQDQLEKLKRVDLKMEEQKRDAMPAAEEIKGKENGKNPGS